jgi:RNA polymerase sigma-70 factor, ECF subfamily
VTDAPSRPKPMDRDPLVNPGTASDLPAIYRSEFSYVWKTLRRLGAPAPDLEDLVHDVFVVVHRHLGDYDRGRPLRPWLFGIALRVVSDFRRAGRNLREVPGQTVEPVDASPSPHERVECKEARAVLLKALESLDLERRAVFVMHELDELPAPEIAAVLAIPLNTAYSRLRLARTDVAAWIARYRAGEGRRLG